MLAHHLYQAGAAADPDRAIANLLRAAERAHGSGAFEQALERCDELLSFDLPPESAERARVEELRAVALLALGRLPEATDPGERALAIRIARRDDAGIMRTAETVGWSLGWRSEAGKQVDALGRAIDGLSPAADKERSRLQSHRAAGLAHGLRFDEALPLMAAARLGAERTGDTALLGYVLANAASVARATGHVLDGIACGSRALALLEPSALIDRTVACYELASCQHLAGQFQALPA